jgi:DNA-binding HxlR family transcriptional regulator
MRRTSFRDWPCSIARTSDLLGDWWTPLVMRELLLGTTRFDDLQRALSIARNVLTERLKRLTEEGIVERRPYQDRPPRFEYHLTEKGRDFYPVILAIIRWGDRWLHDGGPPPVLLRHAQCGEITHGDMVCAHCGEHLQLGDLDAELADGREVDLDVRVEALHAVAGDTKRRERSKN